MLDGKIVALIPERTGPADGCAVLYESGKRVHFFCPVERYMKMVARALGNNNRDCRRLFKGCRGTGVRFNDGSAFVQMKLAKEPPSFGYVRMEAILGILPDEEERGVIYLRHGLKVQTYWKAETASKHFSRVKKVLAIPRVEEVRVY